MRRSALMKSDGVSNDKQYDSLFNSFLKFHIIGPLCGEPLVTCAMNEDQGPVTRTSFTYRLFIITSHVRWWICSLTRCWPHIANKVNTSMDK